MTTIPSTIPAFLEAMVSALETEVADTDTVVFDGWPSKLERGGAFPFESVVVGEVEQSEEQAAQRTVPQPRDEGYTCEFVVRVEKQNQTQRQVRDRAWAIREHLCDIVRQDPHVGQGHTLNAQIGSTKQESFADDAALTRVVLLTVGVTVTARI